MARTQAEDKAIKKYEQEKLDRVLLRMPKGKKEQVRLCAQKHNESVNAYLNRVIDEAIAKDGESV